MIDSEDQRTNNFPTQNKNEVFQTINQHQIMKSILVVLLLATLCGMFIMFAA
jgi:hypothetical protein